MYAKHAAKLESSRRSETGKAPVPHYYFDLIDGFIRKDRRGLDCVNDMAAIIKGRIISREVAAAASDHSVDLHISVVNESEREVFQIPVVWPSDPSNT
jgi:hypothetical protein